jgi:endonuclease G
MQPQYNSLNAFILSDMEAKVRSWHTDSFRDTLYVVKGGTIDGRDNVIDFLTHDDYGVLIPKYFFMALLCVKNGKYKALGFWIEHKPSYSQAEQKSIKQYVVSVDELEQRTGIDFFCNLDSDIQDATEKVTVVGEWSF